MAKCKGWGRGNALKLLSMSKRAMTWAPGRLNWGRKMCSERMPSHAGSSAWLASHSFLQLLPMGCCPATRTVQQGAGQHFICSSSRFHELTSAASICTNKLDRGLQQAGTLAGFCQELPLARAWRPGRYRGDYPGLQPVLPCTEVAGSNMGCPRTSNCCC